MLSIVIVTFNSQDVIEQCLRPLLESNEDDIEIIIVDNASSDSTRDLLLKFEPRILVVHSDKNLGFAGGVNLGASKSRGDVICLLNPDAAIDSTVALGLAAILRNSPTLGVIAPSLQPPSRRQRISSAGRRPTVPRMINHFYGLSRLASVFPAFEGFHLRPSQVSRTRDVDWVTGACLFTSRHAWNLTTGLSERWFMYAEDVDYCLRIADHHLRVVVMPEYLAVHEPGTSTGKTYVRSDWVLNLFDLYVTRFHPNFASRNFWRLSVAFGLLLRALLQSAKNVVLMQPRDANKSRFYADALSLLSMRDRT